MKEVGKLQGRGKHWLLPRQMKVDERGNPKTPSKERNNNPAYFRGKKEF